MKGRGRTKKDEDILGGLAFTSSYHLAVSHYYYYYSPGKPFPSPSILTCQATVSRGFPDGIQGSGSGVFDMITEWPSQRASHWLVVIHNAENKNVRATVYFSKLYSTAAAGGPQKQEAFFCLVISWIFSHWGGGSWLVKGLPSTVFPFCKIQALQFLLQTQGSRERLQATFWQLAKRRAAACHIWKGTSGKAYQWANEDDETLFRAGTLGGGEQNL